MTVVDASVAVEALLRMAPSLATRLRLAAPLLAPALLDVEVVHSLRRNSRLALISPQAAEIAIKRLAELAVARYDHRPLLARMWELRQNLTAYDAAYVALAERVGAPLLTSDARLAAAPGLRCSVSLL